VSLTNAWASRVKVSKYIESDLVMVQWKLLVVSVKQTTDTSFSIDWDCFLGGKGRVGEGTYQLVFWAAEQSAATF